MRRIELETGDVYATNDSDGGLFHRRTDGSAYQQIRGTLQTPQFRTREQFRRYLRRCYGVTGRTVSHHGWNLNGATS